MVVWASCSDAHMSVKGLELVSKKVALDTSLAMWKNWPIFVSTHHLPVNHKREGEKEIRASPSTITEYFKEEKKEKISGKIFFYVVPRWQNKVSKKIFFQEIGCSSKGDNFPHKLAVKIQNAKSFRREIVFRIMVPISKWRRRLEICRVRPNRGKKMPF